MTVQAMERRDPPVDQGLTSEQAASLLLSHGSNDVPEKRRQPLWIFVKKFWGLSAWMLELIAVLSLVLGKHIDFWVSLSLLIVNAILSFVQEARAGAAVSALRRQLHVTARVRRDGTWTQLPAQQLVPGDVVRVRTGDFVPADLQVIHGELQLDQSALTGESQELARTVDQALYSGSTVRSGEATAVVTATGLHTYFGRTAQLVETAQPKLHVEAVIARVVKWLFLIVGTMVAVTMVFATARGLSLLSILPIALVVLMSAIPVALPVMFTVSMALGSLELSRRGVLMTRLSAIEDAASMDVLCADKTGTLTMNHLSYAGALPQPGVSEEDVLLAAAMASNEADADAIDLAVLNAARQHRLPLAGINVLSFAPFSAKSRRTEAVVEHTGQRLRCIKGAVDTVSSLVNMDPAVRSNLTVSVAEAATKGIRTLAIAQSIHDQPLQLLGVILLQDAPRADARQLIDELRSLGVRVKMLTGDAMSIGQEIASKLGLGKLAPSTALRACPSPEAAAKLADSAGGFAEVFPEDKFLVVKSLQAAGHIVGMTGDGVNDAPALKQAEVGIAVNGASDVAKGAASAVLTTQGLIDLISLVTIGRSIYQRILTWIINKISRTILKAGLVVVVYLASGQFVISALGMVALVFMTDFVKISLATDKVQPSREPETWHITPLVHLAVVLGIVMLAEALALLAMCWTPLHLDNGDGRLQTFTFQLLLFFALFSIVSIRERRRFWASKPSRTLMLAILADTAVGLLVGAYGFGEIQPLPLTYTALIIAGSGILVLGLNDSLKAWWMSRE